MEVCSVQLIDILMGQRSGAVIIKLPCAVGGA